MSTTATATSPTVIDAHGNETTLNAMLLNGMRRELRAARAQGDARLQRALEELIATAADREYRALIEQAPDLRTKNRLHREWRAFCQTGRIGRSIPVAS